MALKRTDWNPGRLLWLDHDSQVLRNNPLKDPHRRKLAVWLPPQYDQPRHGQKRFPVLYDLVGFLGSGPAHVNWRNLDENVPERAARLIHQKKMPPAILVFPDCFTALGGNQYINSPAIGRYADYLVKELVPFVDRQFRTMASREHRGCFGKSSGGYGSIIHAMQYPECWGSIANHSGDAYFDFVYMNDWPRALTELMKHRPRPRKAGVIQVGREEKTVTEGNDDGRIKAFLKHVWKKEQLSDAEAHALMMVAMAASYDADAKNPSRLRLPFNLETGERIELRWQKWLQHDPIHLVTKHKKALQSMRGIYMDCGWRDQYQIHFGMRILSKRMDAAGIRHVYEEFDGTHSGIDHRMEKSLPFLAKTLTN